MRRRRKKMDKMRRAKVGRLTPRPMLRAVVLDGLEGEEVAWVVEGVDGKAEEPAVEPAEDEADEALEDVVGVLVGDEDEVCV